MVAAADAAGIVFSAFFQRRFFPAALRMKRAIDDGRLGTLTTAEVVAHMSRDRAYFDRDDWRGTWEGEGGGALMNQAIHLVDLLLWFMGRPVEVYGRWATLHHGDYIDVEDTAVATIEFENGALATIQASTGIDPEFGFRVAVHGTSGDTVSLLENPELTQAITDVWTFAGEEEQRLAWEREESGHFGFPEFHRVQLADFVDAVLDGRPPLVSGAEGVTPVEVIQAIYESQRTRRPVALGRAGGRVSAARPLDGAVALVTGAGGGSGRACALALARAGAAAVAVNYASSADGARETVERLEALGCRGSALQADVGDDAQARALVERTVARFGEAGRARQQRRRDAAGAVRRARGADRRGLPRDPARQPARRLPLRARRRAGAARRARGDRQRRVDQRRAGRSARRFAYGASKAALLSLTRGPRESARAAGAGQRRRPRHGHDWLSSRRCSASSGRPRRWPARPRSCRSRGWPAPTTSPRRSSASRRCGW